MRALTWAWNRLEWPPVEWLAGPADVVHAQTPLLIPAARAAQVITIHDLDFLPHPERTRGGDAPRLPGARATTTRGAPITSSCRRATPRTRSPHGWASPPTGSRVCSPGAPAWAADVAQARAGAGLRRAPSCFSARSSRGRTSAACSTPTRGCGRGGPTRRRWSSRGGVRDSVRRELIARSAQSPLAGHVHASAATSATTRAATLYRDARMLVLPSFEEGFGLPVLEAMACGVPVVVSNRGSLPEVAGDAAAPVEPDDAEALAAEMERLLDPRGGRGGDRARAGAGRALFTWDGVRGAARDGVPRGRSARRGGSARA